MSSLLLPDTGLLFWMTLIFAVVFVLLAKFGFPVITGMVEKRKDYIDRSLRMAEEADVKMSSMRAEQARMIEEARAEQGRILKEAADARDAIIRKAKEQAADEASKMLDLARVQIQAEKESAMSELRSQVAMLSVGIAEKVIRQGLSSDAAQKVLTDKMLDEAVRAGKPGGN